MKLNPEPPQQIQTLLIDTFDALLEGIAIFDADEKLVVCNKWYREQLAIISDVLQPGASWREIIAASIERSLVIGTKDVTGDWQAECDELRKATGRLAYSRQVGGRFYELSYNPMSGGGFFVTRRDVTEQVEAEARLKDREALLSTIFDTNPTPVVMARLEDSKIVYLSPAARDFYGDAEYGTAYYSSAEDRARYVADLKVHGEVRNRRFDARAADGSPRAVMVNGGLTEYDGETCVVSSVTDLTEQVEQEKLIQLVVEACPAPILMIKADTGEILFRSPQATELYGERNSAAEFYVDLADRDGFLGDVRRHREVTDYRLRLLNAKDEPFWCAVSARLIEWGGEDVIVSHSRDLTPQLTIEAELERQRQQVFQSEKLSALGSLLAGVAHELNNPLSVVVGHAMMLADETDDPEVLRQTRKISDAAERCSKIVRTFLTMARQEPVRMEPVDIADLVETAVEVARYGNPVRAVRIETCLDADLPQIAADADQITQAVVNLILNAEQAIESAAVGDRIRVSASKDTSGNAIRIEVEDNGPGIPAEIRARVFDPFFTTKGVGQGTGIGLTVCHRAVTAHDGKIEIGDTEPSGTRFSITLPIGNAKKFDRQTTISAPESQKTVRVLVIDDEVDVADLNVEVLERAGYKADAAYKAATAFEMLRTYDYDVVLSDLNMPDVDGRGVYETIASEFPDLLASTGFVTGDTMGRTSQTFLQETSRPHLEKPVSPKELRAFVAQLNTEGHKQ